MTISFASSVAGLSMLTGQNLVSTLADVPTFESKAVRTAKAQFTLAATTAPWKEAATTLPLSTQLSTIKALKTIIDKPATGPDALPADVQTAFTTYKALDRLQTLATAAAAKTMSDAQRATLQTTFAKGLSDLQAYLAQAPRDKVEIDFGISTRRAETVKVKSSTTTSTAMPGLIEARDGAIPGITGSEVFKIKLNKPGTSDELTIDLSQTTQPPTLDSIANAFNDAIKAIPQRNADGSVYLNDKGETEPKWTARFSVDKGTGKWGFKLDTPNGLDQVSLEQQNAPDALMVATGQTALEAPTATRIYRYDEPTGAMAVNNGATLSGFDRDATARAALLPPTTKTATVKDVKPLSTDVAASTDAKAITTDAQGYSYVVGTTGGDLGTARIVGSQDLFLTKLDSEGKVVWQRELGAAGSAQGAAVQVGSDGSITVAGTVKGNFDGATTDGDMMVARFSANGDQQFATVVRSTGADQANALAVGSDGSIYVGGKTESGDALLAKLDSSGRIVGRRTIDAGGTESVTSLAVDGDGNVLALSNQSGHAVLRKIDGAALENDLGSLDLGSADARALAVAADGTIAIGGATRTVLAGDQVNALTDGRDGFVTRVAADLSSSATTYLGTAEDDQVDSVTFMDGSIYAGGRTTGALTGTRAGTTDGFIARIGASDGAVAQINQFGQPGLRNEPVRVSAARGGDTVLGALGFNRGVLNPTPSPKLTTQTSLRAGDEFSMKVDGKNVQKFTILADDTMDSLMKRIKSYAGSKATVATMTLSGTTSLQITAKEGSPVQLIAGASGKDALEKLGIAPQRLTVPHLAKAGEPKVQPGGTYSLALDNAVNISKAPDAAAAMAKLKSAISSSQSAYRSLYWDDAKAIMVDGPKQTASKDPRIAAQLKNYQAALTRLSTPNTSIGF